MASAERKARPPPPPPQQPLNPTAATARRLSRSSFSSSVGQRNDPPAATARRLSRPSFSSSVGQRGGLVSFVSQYLTDQADALGLRRAQPLPPPPRGSYAAPRSPSQLPSSSSVKRRNNTSPLLVPTTADLHLDANLPLPSLPGIFAGRRPPPVPASSAERHQAAPRPSSLPDTQVPLNRRGKTRWSEPGSAPPEDPPRPFRSSATHSHPTKALPTPAAGSPVLTRDPVITLSTYPFLVPIPRATASSYNHLSKQEAEKRQKQQRNMAEVAVVYRSIVLLIFIAVVLYYECRRPVVLVSEIAAVSCLFLYFWSSHIIQFWLDRPATKDLSVVVLIWCFVLCMLAFLVGVTISPVIGMVITCLAATGMATFFVFSLREYLHTRPGFCVSVGGDGFHDAVHESERKQNRRMRRSVSRQQAYVEVGVPRSIKPVWK